MRCKVNFESDPISLQIVAHNGHEATILETKKDKFFDVSLTEQLEKQSKRIEQLQGALDKAHELNKNVKEDELTEHLCKWFSDDEKEVK